MTDYNKTKRVKKARDLVNCRFETLLEELNRLIQVTINDLNVLGGLGFKTDDKDFLEYNGMLNDRVTYLKKVREEVEDRIYIEVEEIE